VKLKAVVAGIVLDGHLGSGTLFTFMRGKKLFKLANHLGNVPMTNI
jgi:hypothetical protein